MSLLAELEIDAASWEYLAQRIVAHGGSRPPQPIVAILDGPHKIHHRQGGNPFGAGKMTAEQLEELEREAETSAQPPTDDEPEDPDWDELTARAARMCAAPGTETVTELTERRLARMEE